MPFTIDELRAPGGNLIREPKQTDSKQQPSTIEPPVEEKPKTKKPKQTKVKKKQEVSPMVNKAKDYLIILFMILVGITAIALMVRGIQFLFTI